jgi:ABC-2 type transport system permease protein
LESYKETIILGIKQVSNYRFEMWLGAITRFIGLGGLLILWTVIYKENKGLNVREIVSYLLIANSVRDAVDAQHLRLSRELISEIKLGTISSHLLRPINTKLFFYFRFFGNRSINLMFDLLLFIVGLSLSPPKSVWGVVFFFVSVIIAIGLTYCFNVLVGVTAFWTTEASGIRNVVNHFIKVFSGSMIPLSYFPELSKNIILLLPFPVLSYLPAVFISGKEISSENFRSFLVSLIWLLILIPIVNKLWLKGVKDYEAIGI